MNSSGYKQSLAGLADYKKAEQKFEMQKGGEGIRDPFYQVRNDILDRWAVVEALQHTNGSFSSSATDVNEWRDKVQQIEWDLGDLEETVRVVEANGDKFGLDENEVANRKAFIYSMRAKTAELNKSRPAKNNEVLIDLGLEVTEKNKAIASKSTRARTVDIPTHKRSHRHEPVDEGFAEEEIQVRERLVQEQDEGLEVLGGAVERIGAMGREIHRELNEHGEMMDELGEDMDLTNSRMASVQGKLNQFMSETTRKELCTILWLFIAFIILTVLVFAT